jgi:putative tryptophan/tyrosine transport system substrate-binding protein
MAIRIRRREFVVTFGGAAATWPLAAHAQQPAMPVIGFLHSSSPTPHAHELTALRLGLKESGYIEGQNVAIEYRWAENEYDRLPELAADLVRRQVSVIAATGGEPSISAAKAATATIPIVFDSATNPVDVGWVASLSRPGGNMTGVNQMVAELATKEVGLLHALMPQAKEVAMLAGARYQSTPTMVENAQAAAGALGCTLQVVTADSEQELDTAFAAVARQHASALFVAPNPFFFRQREHIVALAARHALPALYVRREFPVVGGLASYGTSLADTYRQIGVYAGRILNGEKPADLPIVQPTKFELVINLKTAKTLGLAIPPGVLAIADEVIE